MSRKRTGQDDDETASSTSKKRPKQVLLKEIFRHEDYMVGWVCPLEVEQTAAVTMLDEEHDSLPQPQSDYNVYNLGSIGNHNVVIAGLQQADNNSAAMVITQMRITFPNLRFGLLVGVGGGVPVKTDNGTIRLGDVVVSKPSGEHSGMIQYDRGKAEAGQFMLTGALAPPPAVLLNAAEDLADRRARARNDPVMRNIKRIHREVPGLRKYNYPGSAHDHLYSSNFIHRDSDVSCNERESGSAGCAYRGNDDEDDGDDPHVIVHRGSIASGELVIEDALLRDQLAKEDSILCFEMEATCAMTDFPCLVIRGISGYCDSHKNDRWNGYASAAAAAYARQLFFHMSIDQVKRCMSEQSKITRVSQAPLELNNTTEPSNFTKEPPLLPWDSMPNKSWMGWIKPPENPWDMHGWCRLEDEWLHRVDNEFALGFFRRLGQSDTLRQLPASSNFYRPCRDDLRQSFPNFKFIRKLSVLRKTSEKCDLCKVFRRYSEQPDSIDQEEIVFSRVDSTLKMERNGQRILRICAPPESETILPIFQIGFPILPHTRSLSHFELLREWLRVCDESCYEQHDCHQPRSGRLPTRVLDVGAHGESDSLRLFETTQNDREKYTALSHRWGELQETQKFCTYRCNINTLRTGNSGYNISGLTQFALSSLIKNAPSNAATSATEVGDWAIESTKMEEYFSSAYCTIAASSAKDSTEGFLGSRSSGDHVKWETPSNGPLYFCEAIDDFKRDVEEGELNKRGWVLQERALSCRTIHFTTTQTYFECGEGVHCETLTRMRNLKASFLGDPQYPKFVLEHQNKNRIHLFRMLFEEYSRLALTRTTDRCIAISGLEKRLAGSFDTNGKYGILECYLHRSLLWFRPLKQSLKRIEYPANQKVPSWSWMAYEGEISYMEAQSATTEWSNDIHCSSRQSDGITLTMELNALARELLLDETETDKEGLSVSGQGGYLVFDDKDSLGRTDIQRLKCVVIGRDELKDGTEEEQVHYILVIAPTSSDEFCRTYGRVGTGCVHRRCILFGGEVLEVQLI